MCHVRVVLLCKGRGGDATSYQPQRDETQWWNRRDALVRCASAFLNGAWSDKCSSRELVLVHDEDWARMHMTLRNQDDCPSEYNVISAWKEAALNPHATVQSNSSFDCRLVHNSLSMQDATAVANMDSKREVLDHLQKHCDLDFLRKHHLNSKPDVVLRKTNKNKLLQVWNEWSTQHGSTQAATTKEIVASIFSDMLKPNSSSINQVIAATLHESSDAELPCFNLSSNTTYDNGSTQIVLFLGAVRDMLPSENNVLERLCKEKSIPLTGVRLGSVPEFTSKILSVVAYHQASGVLSPALSLAIQDSSTVSEPPAKRQKQEECSVEQHMHVVCSIPLSSHELTEKMTCRSRILWMMVRLVVVTLWRSRIASSSATCLSTTLSFIFEDNKAVKLEQDVLVTSLAEQHQAAPSEYQILSALCKTVATSAEDVTVFTESLMNSIRDGSQVVVNAQPQCDEGADFYPGIYNGSTSDETKNIIVIMSLSKNHSVQASILNSCSTAGVNVKQCSILPSTDFVQDGAAASVTMIQHFMYQNRLLPFMSTMEGKKLKHKKKKKKKGDKARRTCT